MTNSICETDECGTKRWYNEKGELHRENDLPAVANGDDWQEWWLNGQRHRENNKPAIIHPDGGSKDWYFNGKLHRENGPAVKTISGYKEWWVDGEQIDCTDNDTFLRMMKLKCFW